MITDESPDIIQIDSRETICGTGEKKCRGRNAAQCSKEKLPGKRKRIYSVSVQVTIKYHLKLS